MSNFLTCNKATQQLFIAERRVASVVRQVPYVDVKHAAVLQNSNQAFVTSTSVLKVHLKMVVANVKNSCSPCECAVVFVVPPPPIRPLLNTLPA